MRLDCGWRGGYGAGSLLMSSSGSEGEVDSLADGLRGLAVSSQKASGGATASVAGSHRVAAKSHARSSQTDSSRRPVVEVRSVGSGPDPAPSVARPTGARPSAARARRPSPFRRYAVWSTRGDSQEWRGVHSGRGRVAYDALRALGVGSNWKRAQPPFDSLADATALFRERAPSSSDPEVAVFHW